jgi:hypothetical protein
MASGDENFPVPMMSRDRKVRPAMVNDWLADDIAANLEQCAGLSRREGAYQPPGFAKGYAEASE